MTSTATKQTFLSYLFFWIGHNISVLGTTVVQFVLIWWIVVEYLNPMYLAIAYLVGIGVQVIFMPIAGVFVDRWSRRLILAVSDILQAVGAVFLILLFTIKDNPLLTPDIFYWLVIAILGFRGIMGSFHAPATKAIVPSMVPRDQLTRLNSLHTLMGGAINII
ncbi:MAG: MFS transporter, partial [Candidatus Heimdallarchaeota archaeon]